MSLLTNTYDVHKGEFETAGDASASIKRKLKQLGVDSAVLRRVAVASYEAELNLIIHSLGGQLTMEMNPEHIVLISRDVGPASRILTKPCRRASPPPARRRATWALAQAWVCRT